MLHAYANPIRIYEVGEGLMMFIGPDRSARMLEVGVVDGDLARRFEDYEPDPSDRRDPGALVAVRDAVIARSEAERALAAVVRAARSKGHSWQSIGRLLGTSGEAARQRYGRAS